MEMVVVIAIFSVLTLIVLNVFILAMQAQRQTGSRQQVLANLRYVLESMAQKIRTSEIDYGYYEDRASDLSQPVNSLALIDQAGNNLRYSLENGVIYQAEGGGRFALTEKNQVIVTKFDFYINPTTNPFAEERCNTNQAGEVVGCQSAALGCTIDDRNPSNLSGYCLCDSAASCQSNNCELNQDLGQNLCRPFNFQPRATIVLGFQSVAARAQEIKTLYLQTTVSSRVYKR